jgi:CBS-domain-containing membrane protein
MYRHNAAADDQRTREKLYAAMVHRQDITGDDIAGHRSKVPQLIDAIKDFVKEQGGEVGSAELGLKDVMNESPLTVDAHCPLPRVWTLFRTMGLRHLVVLDHDHCVVGIITREDLLEVAEHPEGSPRRIGPAESRRVTGQFPTSPRPDTVREADEWDESLLGSE